MVDKKAKYTRKQYFTAARFQLKYVGLILLLMFLTGAMCAYVVYYTTMLLLGEKLANVYPQGRLISMVKLVNLQILFSLILVTPLVALIGIFLSHRIAGPINRMEKFLANMAAGDITSRLVLRSKDEMIRLADGINLVVDSLRVKVGGERERLKRASMGLARLKTAADAKPADIPSIKDSINKLEDEISNLNKELDKYKLE